MRAFFLVLAAMPACTLQNDLGPPSDAASGTDGNTQQHVLESLDYKLLVEAGRVAGFTKINAAPYASAVGSFNINVFVNDGVRQYRQIHPDTTGTSVEMPIGSMIVRQVLDANGRVTKVTLMAKGPLGYDPTLGDWWFGVTDADGVPLSDASGIQLGKLTACHGCHIPRGKDDFLFGVPNNKQL